MSATPDPRLDDPRHCGGPRCWVIGSPCSCRFCEGCIAIAEERDAAEQARTVTLVKPEDVRHFVKRELSEEELRAVLGDAVYEALKEAPRTATAGIVTVTSIDRDESKLLVRQTRKDPK